VDAGTVVGDPTSPQGEGAQERKGVRQLLEEEAAKRDHLRNQPTWLKAAKRKLRNGNGGRSPRPAPLSMWPVGGASSSSSSSSSGGSNAGAGSHGLDSSAVDSSAGGGSMSSSASAPLVPGMNSAPQSLEERLAAVVGTLHLSTGKDTKKFLTNT